MKFENTEVFNFEGALRGMRNPLESRDKSDSMNCNHYDGRCEDCYNYTVCKEDYLWEPHIIGENDLKLAQKLIKSGSEHRKFMRQIFVSVDITAPLYWWKEFDTYKVGTVANSTSTMHKLSTTPITLDCFEVDDFNEELTIPNLMYDICTVGQMVSAFVEGSENLRQKYLETKDKRYWKELIRWLPESWLQTRTVTMNYENLLNMCSKGQRRFHKLNEWSGIGNPNVPNFISWARTLPYAQELIFIDELEDETANV